jgi:hypothetical protein
MEMALDKLDDWKWGFASDELDQLLALDIAPPQLFQCRHE